MPPSPQDAPAAPPKHGEKAWMASDKELDEMPYNNYYLVMPSLMLVLFLAALDQTIVCECFSDL
jgi:quinol-cytochrome oxidoreductase complex cytochrome b subunit